MTAYPASVPVCILAGGLGTRLHPYTTVLPKPLVLLGDRPVLDILLRQLETQGFQSIFLACGGMEGLFRAYLSTYPTSQSIHFFGEPKPLGTAGCLSRFPEPFPQTLLVINGDILTDLDFSSVVRAHESRDAALTVAVHHLEHPLAYGMVEYDERQRLVGYREKPVYRIPVSMGVYVYDRSVLEGLDADTRLDFPDLVLRLLEQGRSITTFPNEARWYDIGSPGDLERALAALRTDPARFLPDPAEQHPVTEATS